MRLSGEAPRITKGLGQYESDYYAILGVPINASDRRLRRGYIQAAKALHPDRFITIPDRIETANWLFSKLVSPASAVLNKPSERKEYQALLRLRMKTLLKDPNDSLWPQHELAEKLRKSFNLDDDYYEAVVQLAETQYENLDEAITRTEAISQVNLAYLLLTEGYKPPAPAAAPSSTVSFGSTAARPASPSPRPATPPPPPAAPKATAVPPAPEAAPRPEAGPRPKAAPSPKPTPPPEPAPVADVSPPGMKRFEQAMNMMERRQYKDAVKFFGFAIREDPENAQFYLQRGIAHQMQRNATLARIDFQKAVELEPGNEDAKRRLKSVSASGKKAASGSASSSSSKASKDDSKKGGLFGRLFNNR
ncbi:MAG: DnaJ domain-containing protein [Cyanobacteria bacterium J06648_11]